MPVKDRVSYNTLVKTLYLLDKESRIILSNFPDNAHGMADMERVKQLIRDFREREGLRQKEFSEEYSYAWLPLYTHFDKTEEHELQMYYSVQKLYDRIKLLRTSDYMRQRKPVNKKRAKKNDKGGDDPFAGEELAYQAESGLGDTGNVSPDHTQDGV